MFGRIDIRSSMTDFQPKFTGKTDFLLSIVRRPRVNFMFVINPDVRAGIA